MKQQKSDWVSFLKMLSLERTQGFIFELALPYSVAEHKKVSQFARACLEAWMVESIEKRKNQCPNLIKFWYEYRKCEGVIPEEKLNKYRNWLNSDCYSILHLAFNDYEYIIGCKLAKLLENWFYSNFHPRDFYFVDLSNTIEKYIFQENHELKNQYNLTILEIELFTSFASLQHIYLRKIANKFKEINQHLFLEGVTAWESVLGTFPADSDDEIIRQVHVLTVIESCIHWRYCLDAWVQVVERIGENRIKQVLAYLEQKSHLKFVDINSFEMNHL